MSTKHLTLSEKETIIRTSEGEKTYNVYTHNKAFQRRLDKLAEEHPRICRRIYKNDEWGDATYVVAKENVILTIRPKREMTAAQRAAVEANRDKQLEALKRGREAQKRQREDARQDK